MFLIARLHHFLLSKLSLKWFMHKLVLGYLVFLPDPSFMRCKVFTESEWAEEEDTNESEKQASYFICCKKRAEPSALVSWRKKKAEGSALVSLLHFLLLSFKNGSPRKHTAKLITIPTFLTQMFSCIRCSLGLSDRQLLYPFMFKWKQANPFLLGWGCMWMFCIVLQVFAEEIKTRMNFLCDGKPGKHANL